VERRGEAQMKEHRSEVVEEEDGMLLLAVGGLGLAGEPRLMILLVMKAANGNIVCNRWILGLEKVQNRELCGGN